MGRRKKRLIFCTDLYFVFLFWPLCLWTDIAQCDRQTGFVGRSGGFPLRAESEHRHRGGVGRRPVLASFGQPGLFCAVVAGAVAGLLGRLRASNPRRQESAGRDDAGGADGVAHPRSVAAAPLAATDAAARRPRHFGGGHSGAAGGRLPTLRHVRCLRLAVAPAAAQQSPGSEQRGRRRCGLSAGRADARVPGPLPEHATRPQHQRGRAAPGAGHDQHQRAPLRSRHQARPVARGRRELLALVDVPTDRPRPRIRHGGADRLRRLAAAAPQRNAHREERRERLQEGLVVALHGRKITQERLHGDAVDAVLSDQQGRQDARPGRGHGRTHDRPVARQIHGLGRDELRHGAQLQHAQLLLLEPIQPDNYDADGPAVDAATARSRPRRNATRLPCRLRIETRSAPLRRHAVAAQPNVVGAGQRQRLHPLPRGRPRWPRRATGADLRGRRSNPLAHHRAPAHLPGAGPEAAVAHLLLDFDVVDDVRLGSHAQVQRHGHHAVDVHLRAPVPARTGRLLRTAALRNAAAQRSVAQPAGQGQLSRVPTQHLRLAAFAAARLPALSLQGNVHVPQVAQLRIVRAQTRSPDAGRAYGPSAHFAIRCPSGN